MKLLESWPFFKQRKCPEEIDSTKRNRARIKSWRKLVKEAVRFGKWIWRLHIERMRTFASIYAPRYPDYSNINVAVVLYYISKDDTRKLLCSDLHLKHKHAFFQNKIVFDDVIRDGNSRTHLWIAMLHVHNRKIKSTGFAIWFWIYKVGYWSPIYLKNVKRRLNCLRMLNGPNHA